MNNNLSISVCSGGWNARDALDAMPITDAIIYDNLVFESGCDKVRKGYEKKGEIDGTNILFAHNDKDNARLLTIRDEDFSSYETDTYTEKLSEEITVVGRFEHCLFVDGAGLLHSILTNGGSTVYNFISGSTDSLSTCDWTDSQSQPITNNLIYPFVYKNRLYFIEKDSFNIWYGAVQSYQGVLTEFSMNSYFRKGGKLIACATWTQDGGDGTDDQLVIFSDTGEVLVYSGTSPEAEDWMLKGRYEIPRPINSKVIKQVKGDIIIGTVAGYLALSTVLSEMSAQRVALSSKINNEILEKKTRFSDINWNCIYYANANRLIFNVPSSESYLNYEWHVYNLENGTWSRFLGQNSLDFCILGDSMYFCNADGVFQDNIGTVDNGNPIKFRLQHAYTDFGVRQKKKINRLIFRYNSVNLEDVYKYVWCDYKENARTFLYSQDTLETDRAIWDLSLWDSSKWYYVSQLATIKAGVAHIPSTYLSVGFWGSTKTEMTIQGADLMVVVGNGLV